MALDGPTLLSPSSHVLLIFAAVIVIEVLCRVFTQWLKTNDPSTFEIRALRARMSSLRAEAEPLNNPGTFAAFSKLQRQLSKLETEEKALAAAPPAPLTIVQRGVQQLPVAIQIVGYVSLCMVFWSTPLFVAPDTDYLLRRLDYSLPSSSISLSDGALALGVIPLLVALRALSAVLLGFVMPPPPAPPKARKFSFLD